MAFLFRENRRHGAEGQTGTTFSTALNPPPNPFVDDIFQDTE